MPDRRVILLDGNHVTVYQGRGRHLVHEGRFLSTEQGLGEFTAYLKHHRSGIFMMLADVAEEGFQLDDIPGVGGRDRIALIKRRLGQYFYGTPLAVALSLGRAREGRRDEKILFAGLTRPDTFTPWIDALHQAEVILAGIYSVPLLLRDLAARLVGEQAHVLLINLTLGGVRQSFFYRGQLYFSRLTPLATNSLDEIGVACAVESAKIHQYLVAQRQIPRTEILPVRILVHPAQWDSLRRYCLDNTELRFEFLSLPEMARRDGFQDEVTDSYADPFLVHRLYLQPPALQFARSGERRFYRLWQIRFGLTSSAWLILAACLLFAGKMGLAWRDTQDHTEQIKLALAADTQRYQSILAGLPPVALSPEELRALIASHDQVLRRVPVLEPSLAHLSRALDAHPAVELLRLEWKITDRNDPLVGTVADPATAKVGAGVTAHGAAQSATQGATQGATPATAGDDKARAVLDIHAQLPVGLANDLRGQFDQVRAFVQSLAAPGVEARVLIQPFDIESTKPLKNRDDSAPSEAQPAPRFAVRLVRRL